MTPADALRQYFGLDAFRRGQADVVDAVLGGRDVLVVMPTGGGKSLCYQLPALLLDGVTVVVSPLIALMKDQVDALQEKGLAATLINSTIGPSEQGRRIAGLERGDYKLVYIAPERFRDRRFTEAMRAVPVAFFAVDEAHCVSMWGHDFRPDYLRVGAAVENLGRPPLAAFTATATPEVRADIVTSLRLRDPAAFVTGFARPNLSFRVCQAGRDAEKFARLGSLIEEQKTGIIYCATRKRVGQVADKLSAWDIAHVAYHGGMDDAGRDAAQESFLSRRADVAVATNAFGMGIDRADIRFVAHFEMAGSIEAYYQEAGRAGRDGEPAVCELLFAYQDKRIQEFFIEGSNPSPLTIREVYRLLRSIAGGDGTIALTVNEIADRLGGGGGSGRGSTNPMAVGTALTILARRGVLERYDIAGRRARGTRLLRADLTPEQLEIDPAALAEKERRDSAKLESMIRYGYARGCRQRWILNYFGEADAAECGRCDGCQPAAAAASAPGGRTPREPDAEQTILLQKALSGVARMSWRGGSTGWRGRFGRARIIDMLLGSRSKLIVDLQLDQLSTHGLLKTCGKPFLQDLFRELERVGLVETQKPGEYPLLTLTPQGAEVMMGRASVALCLPERPRPPAVPPPRPGSRREAAAGGDPSGDGADAPQPDPDLYETLRQKRQELAAENRLRPFHIFGNKTLAAIALARPLTLEEALQVNGVGPEKNRRWMPHFLPLIARHVAEAEAGDGAGDGGEG